VGPLKTGVVFMVASITTGLLAPRVGTIATRLGATWVLLAGALAMIGSYTLFLWTGVTTDCMIIVPSLALTGAGFALAYPALNIQALSGVADDEQGLASGLVGSSFQIGGAIVLAISTALTLAYTPQHATAAQTVHGLHAGTCAALASATLTAAVSIAALLKRRRHTSAHDREAPKPRTLEALDQAT
jgi:MFS transporter